MAVATSTRTLPRPASGHLQVAMTERRWSRLLSETTLPTSPQAMTGVAAAGTLSAPADAGGGWAEEEQVQILSSPSTPVYNAERVIGNGTFGIVYAARMADTKETVAIKKVFVDRRYRNRELEVWSEMRHPNIVFLIHSFHTSGDSPDELYLNMVMEFMPETVYCVMKGFIKQNQIVPRILVLLYVYQASRALAHMHASGIVHRDIKPQNLLVDVSRGHILKLCDFGSAAKLNHGKAVLVAYICSRYYRAPELIFGATTYTSSVDMWSLGCVLAEMLRGKPLFPGENGVDQLLEIIKVVGAPSKREMLAMNARYSGFSPCPVIRASGWSTILSKRDAARPELSDLLSTLLQYDPESRARPLATCAHHCFDVLREERACCPDGQSLPSELFCFTNRELRSCTVGLKNKLIPGWFVRRYRDGISSAKTGTSAPAGAATPE